MSTSCWYFIEKTVVTYRTGLVGGEDFNGR